MGIGKQSASSAKKISVKSKSYSACGQDYPSMMSLYEKESLAAEAKLKAEREKKRAKKP